MRGLGYTCQLSAGTNDVVVINTANDARQWQGLRTLTTTDSLMLYIENDKTTSADDMWLTVGLTDSARGTELSRRERRDPVPDRDSGRPAHHVPRPRSGTCSSAARCAPSS